MGSLALAGVFSGIDTDTFVTRILAISSRPIALQEIRKEQWEEKTSAVDSIAAQLRYLKSIAGELADADVLLSVAASSSDTTILSAIASSGGIEGTHDIKINQLAKSHTLVHDLGVAAETSTVGSSTSGARNTNGVADADATWFTTTGNGATYTFDFGGETDIDGVVLAASTGYTMNQVAALINVRSQAVGGYDAASVVFDTGQYYLDLTAEEPGPVGELAQTLTAGDAVAELNDEADWTKTDGQSGAFVYTYDGVTRTINTGTGSTLTDLVDLINDDAENPGVNASILEYTVDADHVYHLVLTGKDSGSGREITIGGGTTLTGFDDVGDNWTVTQAAQDAQIRVDGYPSSDWIERDSNTITDVIPNVTLTLKNTTGAGESVTVGLTRRTSSVKNGLETLVTTFNTMVDTMNEHTRYDEETETSGALQGSYSVTNILSRIRMILSGRAEGFDPLVESYTMLAEIGVTFDSEGKLEVDSTALDEAIEDDYYAVVSLMSALATGVSDDTYIQFTSAEEDTEAGIYEVEIGFDGSGNIVQAKIRTKGETPWRNATWEGNTLWGESDTPEGGLVFTAQWDGVSSTQTAEIRVLRGLGGSLYDLVINALDDETGDIAVVKEGFQGHIEALEDNIERQTKRLEREETRLRSKFARLEANLARLEAQSGAFEAMMMSLSSIMGWG